MFSCTRRRSTPAVQRGACLRSIPLRTTTCTRACTSLLAAGALHPPVCIAPKVHSEKHCHKCENPCIPFAFRRCTPAWRVNCLQQGLCPVGRSWMTTCSTSLSGGAYAHMCLRVRVFAHPCVCMCCKCVHCLCVQVCFMCVQAQSLAAAPHLTRRMPAAAWRPRWRRPPSRQRL